MPLKSGRVWSVLLVAGLWLACAPAAVQAAPACRVPAPVSLPSDPTRIETGVEVLLDGQRLAPQQVADELCDRFVPVQGTPRFGFEPRGIWLRLRLPELAPERPWRLLIPFVGADRFCAHWPLAGGGYGTQCGDSRDPRNTGAFTEQGWYFAAPAAFDSSRPLLLYSEGRRGLEVPLEFGTADGFVRQQHRRQTGFGMLYGTLFAAIVLGFVMFAEQRDRAYLYFSGFLGTLALYVALRENHLSALGLTGRLAFVLLPAALGSSYVFGTLFHQQFLQTRRHTPRLHRLMTLAMLLTLLPNFALWYVAAHVGGLPLALANSVWITVMVTTIVLRWRQGCRPARYLLVAGLLLAIATLLRILGILGPSPVDPRLVNSLFYAGMCCATGFLMIALVSRIRELMDERDLANELALSNQRLALHRAQYDPVTRLPNASKFHEELQETLGHALHDGSPMALVTIGLDHFGALNYTLGYQIGDSVLDEISLRLQEFAGAGSRLARTGPDLFAWLLPLPPEEPGTDALRQRCQTLQARLAAPLELGSGAMLTASIGIALFPEHATTADRLLQCSDAALHSARLHGPGALRFYLPALHQRASRYLELSRELHRALERDELELHYQPIVSLATGELHAVESLARWNRGDGHSIPPDQFVPVAEASDLLRPFTEWGLRTACRQLAVWHARQLPMRYLSFNLSAHQLRLERLDELILDTLHEFGVPPDKFALEVTEGTLMDNLEATRDLLSRLRSEGIAVAVDDFGVGYASPHYLRMLPVDILKLDGVFLRGVPQEAEANSVLDSLITLGQSLKLRIVTEGIETEAQAQYVGERGVATGQGYWYAPALTAAGLEAWVEQQQARPRRAA